MTITTEDVWTGFHARLLAYVRARSRTNQDAEDILQDVFIKVHRQIGTLDDDAHLASWLYRVTHNTIVDHYRKKPPIPVEADPAEASEDDIPIAEQSLAPFLGTLNLPAIYREALTLTELKGLTQIEMGQRLGLSPSGAKSRVQRGRTMLRDQLVDCCNVELDCAGHVIDFESRTLEQWPEDCACAPQPDTEDSHEVAERSVHRFLTDPDGDRFEQWSLRPHSCPHLD
jgi:RNA polymerase sigma-70 factor (ECF subfamily)